MLGSEFGDTSSQTDQCLAVTLRVEAVSVDSRVVLLEAEEPWLRVARLRIGSYTSNFDIAESKIEKTVYRLSIFIEPSSDTDRVLNREPE